MRSSEWFGICWIEYGVFFDLQRGGLGKWNRCEFRKRRVIQEVVGESCRAACFNISLAYCVRGSEKATRYFLAVCLTTI
jgi:hypothetical protein